MNQRQQCFAAQYLICRNGTEAARLAGYSALGAAKRASILLRQPAIIAALRAGGVTLARDGGLILPLRRDADGLNPRQLRFVDHYRRSRNAADAARRAGYRKTHAAHQGSALLRFRPVIAALRARGVAITYGQHAQDQLRAKRDSYARKTLTARQALFVAEYLLHGNASQAALQAGANPRSAASSGWQMLQRPLVKAAVAQARATTSERTRIDTAQIVAEYTRIAFADIGDVMDWGPEGMRVKPLDRMSRDERAAILGLVLRRGKNGTRLRLTMHSKLKALDALAKYFGLFERAGGRGG